MSTRKRILVLSAGAVVVAAVAAVALSFAPPILLKMGKQGFDPEWALPNPMRDRGPERPARALLAELRAGHARTVLPLILKPPIPAEVLVGETEENPIRSWRLVNWKEIQGAVRVVYRVKRAHYPYEDSLVWMDLKRAVPGGEWSIVDYGAEY